jgi:CRP/FNR family transcriptional regulator
MIPDRPRGRGHGRLRRAAFARIRGTQYHGGVKPAVHRAVFPAANAAIAADDGDAFRFCSTCAFSAACMAQGLDKGALRDLHMLVEHVGPVAPGAHLFRTGDRFEAIAAVRSGTVKTCRVDRDGREQVLAFHLPGEIIGLSAIDGERYPCDAIALDEVQLCRFSFQRIALLAARLPGLQQQLFRLMSRDIGHAERLSGEHSASAGIAGFLVDLSQRLAARGFSATRFELTMPRTDIANYLRLAPETVSRVLRRLQDDGLIAVQRREIEILQAARLEAMSEAMRRG